MTSPTAGAVGAALAELKASTGWTWAQLADAVGASSGDYVRKIAAGAKPGLNLAGNVDQLRTTGTVTAPVARRTTAAGTVARVRAAASTGAPSRTPAPASRTPTASARQLYRGAAGRLGWSRDFTLPRGASDPARGAVSDAVRDELRSIARGQGRAGHRDVEILVTVRFGDGVERTHSLSRRGVSDVLHDWDAGDDLYDYIADAFDGRYGVSAGNIVGVTVNVLA